MSPARLGLSSRPLQRRRAKRQSYSLCLLRGCCALRMLLAHQCWAPCCFCQQCRARTDREKAARRGAKTGSLPLETSVYEDLLDQRQSLCPAAGWWCPVSWGRRLATQASIGTVGGSGCRARPRGASRVPPAMTLMGHRWSCPATSWPPLPQLGEPTEEPTLGAHGATNQLFSRSFPSLSCLLYPKGISLQCQCNIAFLFLHKTKCLYFLFHLVHVLVPCSSFFILCSSFPRTFSRTKPWPLTFPLVSALSSWSLSPVLPPSWDRVQAWYFHSHYARRRQPLYWGLASAQWSSARPAA